MPRSSSSTTWVPALVEAVSRCSSARPPASARAAASERSTGSHGRPVGGVDGFELGQSGGGRVALSPGAGQAGLRFAQLDLGLAPGVARQASLQGSELGFQSSVLFGGLRLGTQLLDPGLELGQQVPGALHVAPGLLQAAAGLLPLVTQAAHPGGLFDQRPAGGGDGLDDEVDVVLGHHRVAVLAQASAGQQRIDVLQPGRGAVDVVMAFAGAIEPPRDFDLAKLDRQPAIRVVDHEGHLGHPDLGFARATGIDEVLHALAANLARVALPQRPADGVHQVGLAAPIGPHDPGDAVTERQVGQLGECLKTLDAKGLQVHGMPSHSWTFAPTVT